VCPASVIAWTPCPEPVEVDTSSIRPIST
jgi:hypothetical protein